MGYFLALFIETPWEIKINYTFFSPPLDFKRQNSFSLQSYFPLVNVLWLMKSISRKIISFNLIKKSEAGLVIVMAVLVEQAQGLCIQSLTRKKEMENKGFL